MSLADQNIGLLFLSQLQDWVISELPGLYNEIIFSIPHFQNNLSSYKKDLVHLKVKESEVTQSCTTLGDPMNCSPPRSSVHGIFQATALEQAAIYFSRGSSWPRKVSHIVGRHFTVLATREALDMSTYTLFPSQTWTSWMSDYNLGVTWIITLFHALNNIRFVGNMNDRSYKILIKPHQWKFRLGRFSIGHII